MAQMAPAGGSATRPWLRLRQDCLVAADLARETDAIHKIFGLEVCHRDPNVARYGLENVLFPIGTDFIEIVAPTRPGTAAGRFLERHDGRFGYMIIMDCDDPLARQAHCDSIGIRTANLIRHDTYLGVQLHPKDTGGAMLEFNRTDGGQDAMGPYAPAGPEWQQSIRRDVTQRLLGADIETPDPAGFAARWSAILQRPVKTAFDGRLQIPLDSGSVRFMPSNRPESVLSGIEVQVANPEAVLRTAKELDCIDEKGEVSVCGIRVRLGGAA